MKYIKSIEYFVHCHLGFLRADVTEEAAQTELLNNAILYTSKMLQFTETPF